MSIFFPNKKKYEGFSAAFQSAPKGTEVSAR